MPAGWVRSVPVGKMGSFPKGVSQCSLNLGEPASVTAGATRSGDVGSRRASSRRSLAQLLSKTQLLHARHKPFLSLCSISEDLALQL